MATISFGSNRIVINGLDINIRGNQVFVDGKQVEGVEHKNGILEIRILEGVVENVTTEDASVTCGPVTGSVQAGNSVDCKDVGGNVKAGNSVNCGDVQGNIKAGGSINCGDVGGEVKSSGSMMRG